MTDQEQIINLQTTGRVERLDKWLALQMPERSRAEVRRWISEGRVLVNGSSQKVKASYRLGTGNIVTVRVPLPTPTTLVAEDIPLDILYEDSDLLVINKPAGMVVHPAAGHEQGTLVNAVLGHAPDLVGVGGEQRPGIVHRLDKETSGIILVAKNDSAHRTLQAQFKARTVQKDYVALVEGHVQLAKGRIEAAIGRDPNQRKRMAILKEGRAAITDYEVIAQYPGYTYLSAHPLTGRTHQIRVHMAFIGHPVVGDTVYGRRHKPLPPLGSRHFLHAHHVRFRLPRDGREVEFTAPLPPELRDTLGYVTPKVE